MTDEKRRAYNSLTMAHRIKMLDWIRLHADDLPNLFAEDIVAAVREEIGHSCSLHQIRETAKAASIRWAIKKQPPSSNTGSAGRMDRLEARIFRIEEELGMMPIDELPTDEDLDRAK